MNELAQVLDAFDRSPPKAAIFRSGKEAGFIAGADIQNSRNSIPPKGRELVERGWNLFNRLAAVPIQRWRWCAVTALVEASNWRWPAVTCWLLTSPERRWDCRKSCSASSPAGGMLRLPNALARQRRWI